MQVRAASGGVALAAVLSLSACDGDGPTAGAASPEPASPAAASVTTAAAPQVVVDADLFKRRRAQLEAVSLDCLGGRVASVTSDRAPDPNATPLVNPDPETDGLAAFAAAPVPEHTHAMNRGWDDAKPPTPIYLFPRAPAQAGRAVVRWESRPGVAVAALVVGRDVPRGPWHGESSYWCSW